MKLRHTHPHHLFIDMSAGIAGDMFLGALLDLEKNKKNQQALIKELTQALSTLIKDAPIELTVKTVIKKSIRSTHIHFQTPEDDWSKHLSASPHSHTTKTTTKKHTHTHGPVQRTFQDIVTLIEQSSFSKLVRERAYNVFKLLASAEATVHNTSIDTIHFHEVGSLDAIFEILGVCLLLEAFHIQTLSASPLILGSGFVQCAHGKMPVPVPAVTEMLAIKQAPFRNLNKQTGELTTPTGAALVLALAEFKHTPSTEHTLKYIGWGAGTKDFEHFPNVVRLMLLSPNPNAAPTFARNRKTHQESDEVIEVKTSLDDVTGENLAVLMEKLMEAGALDVYFEQVVMKKSRPGIVINALVSPEKLHHIGSLLLTNSPAIGYRYHRMQRHKIIRKQEYITLDGLKIAIKVSITAKGKTRLKVEDASMREALEKLSYNYDELEYRIKQIYYKSQGIKDFPT